MTNLRTICLTFFFRSKRLNEKFQSFSPYMHLQHEIKVISMLTVHSLFSGNVGGFISHVTAMCFDRELRELYATLKANCLTQLF